MKKPMSKGKAKGPTPKKKKNYSTAADKPKMPPQPKADSYGPLPANYRGGTLRPSTRKPTDKKK